MDEFTKSKLVNLCQMVYRGSKPSAMLLIKDKDFKLAKIICMVENCKFKGVSHVDGWKVLWIYIRDEISQIIDILPENPISVADHYLLGALFGYSNDAICDFIGNLSNTKNIGDD